MYEPVHDRGEGVADRSPDPAATGVPPSPRPEFTLPTTGASPPSDKRGNWDDRGMTRSDGYLLDNRQSEAGQRFDAFAMLFDPTTFRHLEGFGVGPGWRIWEVGVGGTSVVSWLAKKVGPTGKVLATDINTSQVASAARPPIEVRVHDVGAEEPPGRASTSSTPASYWSMSRTGNGRCAR